MLGKGLEQASGAACACNVGRALWLEVGEAELAGWRPADLRATSEQCLFSSAGLQVSALRRGTCGPRKPWMDGETAVLGEGVVGPQSHLVRPQEAHDKAGEVSLPHSGSLRLWAPQKGEGQRGRLDRGNSLPCVLEQKVRGRGRGRGWRAGDRTVSSGGGPAWGEAREVNALRGPLG